MSGTRTLEERTALAGDAGDTPAPAETRGHRVRRKARRGRLHVTAIVAVGLLVLIVALAVTNTGRVRLHWIIGSGSASLAWIVLLAVVLGWLLGLATGAVLRWRTRAPAPKRSAAAPRTSDR